MKPTTLITKQHMRVPNFDGLAEFYCDLLGMQVFKQTSDTLELGFRSEDCLLSFSKKDVTPAVIGRNDLYWKIGITVRDLKPLVLFLRRKGVDITDANQFLEIGYMSKLRDPNGFTIELLQQGFEWNDKPLPEEGHYVGAQATLAHITFRVTDIETAKNFFGEKLGMRLISVQKVEQYGFSLYFYCWDEDKLPNADIESVENREWLWERPYTLIELKHMESADAKIHKNASTEAGCDGFSIKGPDKESFISIKELESLS